MSQPGREAKPAVHTRTRTYYVGVHTNVCKVVQSLLLSHAVRTTIKPARFVHMRTLVLMQY